MIEFVRVNCIDGYVYMLHEEFEKLLLIFDGTFDVETNEGYLKTTQSGVFSFL